jgi:hypothetical protein
MIVVLRPGVAAADPALLEHRDIGQAVLSGEVIGGAQPWPPPPTMTAS